MANSEARDASAQRLLDAIGASELDYFSAAQRRGVAEAIQTWPLLAAITRTLQVERAAADNGVRGPSSAAESMDPPLRVVEGEETSE
jgi:hypothetical protein